jgi:thiamine-monophosphate kinase
MANPSPKGIDELELIARLTRDLPANASVIAGPGDDCAVLDLGVPGHLVVFKTDALVQDIHFTMEIEPPRVGHKALARVLSDFAAAAATPVAAVITLGLPTRYDLAWIEGVYTGLRTLATRWEVAIVGGETTCTAGPVFLSIAAVGRVERNKVVRRCGARPGDAVFVSGELGGSIEGRHLDFEPRLAEARWLADNFLPHAMIDLSDGLASDLRHVLGSSRAGAEIRADSIPVSRAARHRCRGDDPARGPLAAALSDGEDYELLFTVASGNAVRVLDGWKAQFPAVRLTCIGRITSEPGLRIRDRQGLREVGEHGYRHFT